MPLPLVSQIVDLRDFPFMPLDVVRLRDSDLAAIASGEAFRAAVLLWCASWHQVPAASLPVDDRMLARLAGYGRDLTAWEEVKEDALRGFVTCEDGRLYHPVIAEKANDAWRAKELQRRRTAAATASRTLKQASQSNDPEPDDGPDPDRYVQRDVVRDEGSEEERDDTRNVHQGTGIGIGIVDKEEISSSLRSEDCPKPAAPERTRRAYTKDFETWWSAYPTDKNMSKSEAYDVWKKLSDDDRRSALTAVSGFVEYCRKDPTYRPIHACRFLSKRRFDGFDQGSAVTPSGDPRINFGGGFTATVANVLKMHSEKRWPPEWGPRIGEVGCRVPKQFWPPENADSVERLH